jgi:hypothetical protein
MDSKSQDMRWWIRLCEAWGKYPVEDPDEPRWHVTASADAIRREGFKRTSEGGIGIGGTTTSGNTYTLRDRDNAQRLADKMNKMEAVRLAPDPISKAVEVTGEPEALIREWMKHFLQAKWMRRNFYEPANEREQALYATTFGFGGYIPATSFMHDGPPRHFSVIPVDVSQGTRLGEKDGEESWEPSTIKVAA